MWTTINSFPNFEINKLGQIRNKVSKKILSQSLSSKGYYQVNIDNKSRRTHRLLAETFIPNPDNLETVNHKDGNKLNNSLDNLEWMSRKNNIIHSREVLGIIPIPYSKISKIHHNIGRKGDKSTAGKPIIAILDNGKELFFGSAYEAAEELFNNPELGKSIRQAIKRGNKYKNINFKDYEKSNKS